MELQAGLIRVELQVEFKEATIKVKSCSSCLCCANRNTQLQMLWRSRAFAKFFDCMTWLAKMDLIPIFTLSKGSNGLVLNLSSWESVRCVGIFVVLIIWILFVGSESCKLGINEMCRHLCCTYYLDLICWFWILQAGKHGMMMQRTTTITNSSNLVVLSLWKCDKCADRVRPENNNSNCCACWSRGTDRTSQCIACFKYKFLLKLIKFK